MRFKLIIALVDDNKTGEVTEAAREAGATGITVIGSARGEGINPRKTFLGLTLDTQRDVLLLVVEEHLARPVLEKIGEVGEFDTESGTGIAVLLDVEDAVGVAHQVRELSEVVEVEL